MSGRLSGMMAVALIGCALGCESGEPPPRAAPSATAPAPPPEPPPPPPTPSKPVTFTSSDGATLAGDLFLAADPASPVVVTVHRRDADRSEFGPLVEKLRGAKKRYSILAFDLRGHGESKAPKGAKADDLKNSSKDVEAAIEHALVASGGKARAVVLVGSSLGATLASEVAFGQAKVTALGLISPGAAISGRDLYRPYAEVRNLPTFIAGAKEDTVATSSVDSLEKMAMHGTVKRYDGSRHSAGHLGAEHPELWNDLEAWLSSVYDEQPTERRSLYYAPGKEPKKPGGAGASQKKRGG